MQWEKQHRLSLFRPYAVILAQRRPPLVECAGTWTNTFIPRPDAPLKPSSRCSGIRWPGSCRQSSVTESPFRFKSTLPVPSTSTSGVGSWRLANPKALRDLIDPRKSVSFYSHWTDDSWHDYFPYILATYLAWCQGPAVGAQSGAIVRSYIRCGLTLETRADAGEGGQRALT